MESKKEYIIWGMYGQHGWEEVCREDNLKDCIQRLKEYEENEPQFQHRWTATRFF